MFARLFGNSVYRTKTIQRVVTTDASIPQQDWSNFLTIADLKLCKYHDCEDIILISSPYRMEHIIESLNVMLNQLNLVYIAPIVIQYLYGDEKVLQTQLEFVTAVNMADMIQLRQSMAIIIIDIRSSEMIAIPVLSEDLVSNNSRDNKHKSAKDTHSEWWSTDTAVTNRNFQQMMDDICAIIDADAAISKYFNIYTGTPPATLQTKIQQLHSAVHQLELKKQRHEKKIAVCVKKAKMKKEANDRNGALFELKKKKRLELMLGSIMERKIALDTKILTLECSAEYAAICAEHDEEFADELEELDMYVMEDEQHVIAPRLANRNTEPNASEVANLTKTEEEELAELEAMMNDELI